MTMTEQIPSPQQETGGRPSGPAERSACAKILHFLFSPTTTGGWLSVILPVGIATAAALIGIFWPVESAGGGSEMSSHGHIALRLTMLIGGISYGILMRLLFYSHESGIDEQVDQGLSPQDGRPIRDWNGNPLHVWNDGKL